MLAERGQMMTTERTAIRRRLAVRRTAHRPPWSGRKARHGSIVAPLAATLAATVAIGVGVALARGERERRASRERRARARSFALLAGERVGDGLRRMALGQLDLAIEQLEKVAGAAKGRASAKHAVHETRKALKRLRALLRLLKDDLGEQDYRRESAVLRDAGRRLARARDAEVMLDTLDDLLGRASGKLARRRGVKRLRARLVAERDAAAEAMLADHAMRARVLGDLRMMRGRVAAWRLADHGGIELVEPGLQRLYRQGRRRRERVAGGSGERTRAMHLWRKRVKDLRYAAEMLDRVDEQRAGGGKRKGKQRAGGGKRKGKRARKSGAAARLHGVAARADELGEVLGEEHDLAVLAARVQAEARAARGSARPGTRTRKLLLKAIAQRRRRLRRRALRDGRRLYGRSPKKFVRRVRRGAAASLSRR
jgi:CHAD domain-containing protein